MSQIHRPVLFILPFAVLAVRAASADDKPAPRFEITPKVWVVGDPKLDIRLVNLPPKQKVTVIGHTGRDVSRIYRKEHVADDKGQLDLRGAYEPGPKTGAPFRILWETKDDPAVEPLKQVGL